MNLNILENFIELKRTAELSDNSLWVCYRVTFLHFTELVTAYLKKGAFEDIFKDGQL